jgi:plasmid stabilization system protein ParE
VPKRDVGFHPDASADYEEAFAWYFVRGATLALDFEREVERCLRLIAEAPFRWPAFDAERRRIVVRKFPYSIVYEVRIDRSWFSPWRMGGEGRDTGEAGLQTRNSTNQHGLSPP